MSFFQLAGIYKHPATECLWKEKQSLPLAVFFIIPGLRALMMQVFPVQDSFPKIIDEHYLSSSLLKPWLKPFLRPPCSAILNVAMADGAEACPPYALSVRVSSFPCSASS